MPQVQPQYMPPDDPFAQLFAGQTPVVRAAPTGPVPQLTPAPAPMPAPRPIPSAPAGFNPLSPGIGAILAALGFQPSQGQEQAYSARHSANMDAAAAATAKMRANNANIRQMLSKPLGSGPQLSPDAVGQSGGIDPLSLFGGQTPQPRIPGPPTALEIVQGPELQFSPPGQPPPGAEAITTALGPSARPHSGARRGQP